MSDRTEIEIFIAMNEHGEFAVHSDQVDAADQLQSDSGGTCMRIVKLKVKMAAPVITESEVDVPDEAGETTQVEAA